MLVVVHATQIGSDLCTFVFVYLYFDICITAAGVGYLDILIQYTYQHICNITAAGLRLSVGGGACDSDRIGTTANIPSAAN